MNSLRLALILSLGFSFAACGKVVPLTDGDGGTTVDGREGELPDASIAERCAAPIAFEDLALCLEKAQCQQLVRCTPLFKDIAECEANLADVFNDFSEQVILFGNAIDAGKAAYDADIAADCLDSFATGSCDSDGGSEACEAVFRGTSASNSACLEEFECAELGSRCENQGCDGTVECCLGNCVSPVNVGQNCEFAPCRLGDKCVSSPTSPTATCQSGDAGSTCSDTFDCDDELFCDINQSRCAPDRPAAASCIDRRECEGDLDCVFGTCGSVASAGDACEFGCLGTLTCVNNQCAALPGLGEDCPTSQCNSILLDCVGPSGAQQCGNKGELDETCGERQCMPGLVCEDRLPQPPTVTRCIEPLSNGAECFSDDTCDSGHCAFNMQAGQELCSDPLDCYSEVTF
tara:strand:+ start:9248 stop:10459 length:1212 start_codon:yes stop_codon:yes gene_type:complete